MEEEITSLLKNNTWGLVALSPEQNILSSKWVYRLKQVEYGNFNKYKVKQVENGMRQHDWIDYQETFALVIKLATIWLILSITVTKDWELKQLDVSNARFLTWYFGRISVHEIATRIP